jgi:hypothetical protein
MNLHENISRLKELMGVISEQPTPLQKLAQEKGFGIVSLEKAQELNNQGKLDNSFNPISAQAKSMASRDPIVQKSNNEKFGKIDVPKTDVSKMYSQFSKKVANTSLSTDFKVDALSAALDVIPGIGNVLSFAIDEVHALSYFYRASKTSGLERTEFILLGLVTAVLGFIPIGGNIASAGLKQGVKNVLKMTPDQIQKWAISKGIIKYRILLNIKTQWNYPWWLFLIKLFRSQGVDVIVKQVEKLKVILTASKSKLQSDNLLTPELNEVFDTAISWLEPPSPEQLAVMEEMVDKGII